MEHRDIVLKCLWACISTHTHPHTRTQWQRTRDKCARFAFSLIFLCGFLHFLTRRSDGFASYNHTNGDRLRQHLPIPCINICANTESRPNILFYSLSLFCFVVFDSQCDSVWHIWAYVCFFLFIFFLVKLLTSSFAWVCVCVCDWMNVNHETEENFLNVKNRRTLTIKKDLILFLLLILIFTMDFPKRRSVWIIALILHGVWSNRRGLFESTKNYNIN